LDFLAAIINEGPLTADDFIGAGFGFNFFVVPVPEPGSFAVCVLGLVGLAAFGAEKRGKRHKSLSVSRLLDSAAGKAYK
jgi:hypothetical protein